MPRNTHMRYSLFAATALSLVLIPKSIGKIIAYDYMNENNDSLFSHSLRTPALPITTTLPSIQPSFHPCRRPSHAQVIAIIPKRRMEMPTLRIIYRVPTFAPLNGSCTFWTIPSRWRECVAPCHVWWTRVAVRPPRAW